MAGRLTLDQLVEVQILCPQPRKISRKREIFCLNRHEQLALISNTVVICAGAHTPVFESMVYRMVHNRYARSDKIAFM